MPFALPAGVAAHPTTPKTDTPTINTPFFAAGTWRYTVKNNDASTATIYSDVGVNPPTTSRGSVASGANTVTINTGLSVSGFTIYARAQASGELMSDVTSYYQA